MRFAGRFLPCLLPLSWLLVACGGGHTVTPVAVAVPATAPTGDPLQPYREQNLRWTLCDPTILGIDLPDFRAKWSELGDRLQCATLRAPLNYASPSRGDVAISVMRVSVADAARRRGAIFFNPGGPGGDGLSLSFAFAFPGSDPSTPVGALESRLRAE